MMPTRYSAGVILCRRNGKTGRPEALLVHKRSTYAYADFLLGKYENRKAGLALLENMTLEELNNIMSLDFKMMWFRAMLSEPDAKKQARFESMFMRDGGAGLRAEAQRAPGKGATLWEVPKGRHNSTSEPDVLCATRELFEEAKVSKRDFFYLPCVKRRESHVSGGIRYDNTYYIGVALPHLAAENTRRVFVGSLEISEARWMDIETIRLTDTSRRLEALIAPAFSLMKIYERGKWDSRRVSPLKKKRG